MSAPRQRRSRSVDGIPIEYASGDTTGPHCRPAFAAAEHLVGDAYGRLGPRRKRRLYLGPVYSSVTADGGLGLTFQLPAALPIAWGSGPEGQVIELELEPAELLDQSIHGGR